jgi:hypothetical protein
MDGRWDARVRERLEFAKEIDELTAGLQSGGRLISTKERDSIADDLLRCVIDFVNSR